MRVQKNTEIQPLLERIDETYLYGLDEDDRALLIKIKKGKVLEVIDPESSAFKKIARKHAIQLKIPLSEHTFKYVQSYCNDQALLSNKVVKTYQRVAPIEGGFEVDMGDEEQTRIAVTPGKVEIKVGGSDIYFTRPPSMLPMTMPHDKFGDIEDLLPFLTLDPIPSWLFISWLTYTLRSPKVPDTSFVHFLGVGDQGAGKSFLSRELVGGLIDPSKMGLQQYPTSSKELTLTTGQAHLSIFDNMTYLKISQANELCMLSTSGSVSARTLYTNSEITTHKLHAPVVLNGLTNFIPTSDLAQRCLVLEIPALDPNDRRSEKELMAELNEAKPRIMKGMFDLCAEILEVLPTVTPKYKERMIDFSYWLAAIEKVKDFDDGLLQQAYHDLLVESQLDSVMGDPLAAAVYQLVTTDIGSWKGTAKELLNELESNCHRYEANTRSRNWPQNAISLSKRLRIAKAGLLVQGIEVTFRRGKERMVFLENKDMY